MYVTLEGQLYVASMRYLLFHCRDVGDSPTDQVQEDMDSEVYPSEDGENFFYDLHCSKKIHHFEVQVSNFIG